jgi:hypothetical protein
MTDVESLSEKSDVNVCVVSMCAQTFFIAKEAEVIHAEDHGGKPVLYFLWPSACICSANSAIKQMRTLL